MVGQSLGQLIVHLGVNDKSLRTGLNDNLKEMRNFGTAATLALTVPITIQGAAVFNVFKKYERTLAEITGLTGTSKEQTEEWDKAMQGLAGTMGNKPQELAEAMYFIASSGLEDAYAMDVLTNSAKASIAGLGAVQQVADLVTSALNAYGTQNLTAAYATDALTAAVREGKLEADQLSHVMGYAIPLGAEMGVSFDQVAAALAAMSTTGIEASTAAVNLRQIFSSFLKPSQQTVQFLDKMGMSVSDLQQRLRSDGLLETLGFLKKETAAFGGSLANIFPDVRELTGALSLSGNRLEANRVLFDLVTNSIGDTQKAYQEVTGTLDQQYNIAVSNASLAMINLGKAFKEYAVAGVHAFTSAMRGAIAIIEMLGPVTKFLIATLTSLLAVLGPVTLAIWAIGKALLFLNTVVVNVRYALWALNFYIVMNPWIALAAGIGVAAMALITFANAAKRAKVKDITDNLENQISSINKASADIKQTLEKIEELKFTGKDMLPHLGLDDLTKYRDELKLQLFEQAKLIVSTQALYEARKKDIDFAKSQATHFGQKIPSGKYAFAPRDADKADAYTTSVAKLRTENGGLLSQLTDLISGNNELKAVYEAASKAVAEYAKNSKALYEKEALRNIRESITLGESVIKKMSSVLGTEYDANKESLDLYMKSIEAYLEHLPVADKRVQKLKTQLLELREAMNKQKWGDIDLEESLFGKSASSISQRIELLQSEMRGKAQAKGESYKVGGEFLFDTSQLVLFEKELEGTKKKVKETQKTLQEMLAESAYWYSLSGDSQEFMTDKLQNYRQEVQRLYELIQQNKKEGFIDTDTISQLTQAENSLLGLQNQLKVIEAQKYVVDNLGWAFSELGGYIGGAEGEMIRFIGTMIDSISRWVSFFEALNTIATATTTMTAANAKAMVSQATATSAAAGASSTLGAAQALQAELSMVNMASQVALTGSTIALTKALAAAAMTGAVAASAWVPFPGNLAAMATSVGTALGLLGSSIPAAMAMVGAVGLAEGGLVPSGYPNDTYPALLTSGEMVVPAQRLPEVFNGLENQNNGGKGEVVFRISGEELVGILKKQSYKTQKV